MFFMYFPDVIHQIDFMINKSFSTWNNLILNIHFVNRNFFEKPFNSKWLYYNFNSTRSIFTQRVLYLNVRSGQLSSSAYIRILVLISIFTHFIHIDHTDRLPLAIIIVFVSFCLAFSFHMFVHDTLRIFCARLERKRRARQVDAYY